MDLAGNKKGSIGISISTTISDWGIYPGFLLPEAKLCVEMDSDLHDVERDKVRDEYLMTQGILTIRIPNVDYLALKQSPSRDWLRDIQRNCEVRTGRPAFPD